MNARRLRVAAQAPRLVVRHPGARCLPQRQRRLFTSFFERATPEEAAE
jgi:hypothetical protein